MVVVGVMQAPNPIVGHFKLRGVFLEEVRAVTNLGMGGDGAIVDFVQVCNFLCSPLGWRLLNEQGYLQWKHTHEPWLLFAYSSQRTLHPPLQKNSLNPILKDLNEGIVGQYVWESAILLHKQNQMMQAKLTVINQSYDTGALSTSTATGLRHNHAIHVGTTNALHLDKP